MKKIVTHLTFYVLLAIIAGILVGQYYHQPENFNADTIGNFKKLGSVFIEVIKIFVIPIIFLTIVLGVGSMGNLKKVGRIGLKSLIYFEVVTTFALVIGVALALILKPGAIDSSSIETVAQPIKKAKGGIPITLIVLVFSIFVGIALNYWKKREKVVHQLEMISKKVFKVLKYIMYFAPVAAFGAMAATVGEFGLDTLIPLGKLVLSVYFTMFVFVILILGSIMRYYKLNIFKFIKYIREEILIVLGTSSSESALPKLMEKLEAAGCKKSVVGLVVPTGYSFNLDGTSIYLSMAVIFLAQINNIQLSFTEILTMIGILMLTSKGAAGVAGSGFVILGSTLESLHTIPMASLAFLLGVDKFLSEARAITNFIGNGVATIVIAKSEKEFDEKMYHNEVSNKFLEE